MERAREFFSSQHALTKGWARWRWKDASIPAFMSQKPATWQLYIRHAHRETFDRELDNGLSDKGIHQCERLVNVLGAYEPPFRPNLVLTSPKLRCWETAQFVAEWAGVEVKELAELDEQQGKESRPNFEKRVISIAQKLKPRGGMAVVSHGDVLNLLSWHFGNVNVGIKKGDIFVLDHDRVTHLNDVRIRAKRAAKGQGAGN
jgi:broad specificity phosphatase PhoE